MIETCLNLFGLLLTGLGAFVTARSVIISKDQAKMLSGTHWNGNEALRRALLAQSHNATSFVLAPHRRSPLCFIPRSLL